VKSLKERAAKTTPMSEEVVKSLDDAAFHGDGYWEEVEKLCVSHEALRRQTIPECDKMFAKLEECVADLEDNVFAGVDVMPAAILKLRAILEGKA